MTMEQNIISLAEIASLKKKRLLLWLSLGAAFAFWLLFTVFCFIFQTRETQTIWIFLGTVVTSLWLTLSGYALIKMLGPLSKYLTFCLRVLSKSRPIDYVRIIETDEEPETFRGFKTHFLVGSKIDEPQNLRFRYEASYPLSVKSDAVYEIESYDGVIVRLKEKP